jgi:hypothetical protein
MKDTQEQRQGAYCVICGAGPFTKVGTHTRQMHGLGSAEYERRFPGVLMTDPSFKHAFALEFRENGGRIGSPRQRMCRAGLHAMRGSNVGLRGGDRFCKRCYYRLRREMRRRRKEVAGTKFCECGCGTKIPKVTAHGELARYASGHNSLKRPEPWSRQAYRTRLREAAGTKLCECGCGEEIYKLTTDFKPARFKSGHNLRPTRGAEPQREAESVT